MIFVTVGQVFPFDRLIRTVDQWASRRGRSDLFAQIGNGEYEPQHMRWRRRLSPSDFVGCAREAKAIVAHAGMGTVLTAIDLRRPLVVMPRRAGLREHDTDHQLATARYLAAHGHVAVAFDEDQLTALLDRIDCLEPCETGTTPEAGRLIAAIRDFIEAC